MIRSATSKTSFMLWETNSAAWPCSARRRVRSSTIRVWATPSAAVGSSMITSFASQSTAFAIATDCRWPPESEATGWRIERTVVTARLASVSLAAFSIDFLVEEDASVQALTPEEHVLHDVQVVTEREILVDGLDAERGGLAGRANPDRLPVPEDLPVLRSVDPGDAS